MKKKIFNVLKNLDIYGFNFSLRYKNESEYNTACGIFFSLISIFIILLLSCLYSLKMILRTKFSLVTNYNYLDEIEIDLSKIPFMLSLINYVKEVDIDSSYALFTLDVNTYTPKTNEIGILLLEKESHSIELEPCSLNNFGEYSSLFSSYSYQKNVCVKPNQNIKIKNRYGDQVKGYITFDIHLVKCVNKTDSNFCKSSEEINNYLLNSYVSLFYISQTTNHFNISNPVVNKVTSDTFSISLSYIKKYFYFFSKEQYISDNGIILNKKNEFNLFQYHHTHFDFFEKQEDEILMDVIFSCHDLTTEYNREYLKIQDVLSFIGGIFDIIFSFLNVISYYFIKKSFINEISHSFTSNNYKNLNNNISDSINQNLSKSNNINKCSFSSIPFKNKKSQNTVILFNVKVKNDILNELNINEEKLKTIQNEFQKKKKWYFYLLYYIFPFFQLDNNNAYKIYVIYLKIYHRFMSIDFLIPMILKSYQDTQ